MQRNKLAFLTATFGGAVVGFLGLGRTAIAADPSYDELLQRVERLQARVDQLETKTPTTEDANVTVDRVLRDAEQRSQLLQTDGITAGWQKDRGFFIQDPKGNWVLSPFVQMQFRSVTTYRENGKAGGDDWQNGFEVRRMKFGFGGNAFSPKFTYYFRWNTLDNSGPQGASVYLEEAWARYFFANEWALRLGQFTNPVFREQTVSYGRQLLVDRSLANQLVTGTNQAYTQAVSLLYDGSKTPFRVETGFEDGFNSANTDFRDPSEGGATDWGAFSRVNWFVTGDRKSADDFTALGIKRDLLVVGGGIDATQAGDTTSYLHVADVQWKSASGIGLYAAYLGDLIDNAGASSTQYKWGALVQVAYLLTDKWEVFGRYDFTKLNAASVAAGQHVDYNELSAGLNWYIFGGHNAKFTVDLTYLPNGVPADLTAIDFLQSQGDEIVLRGQFQLLL